MTNFNSLFIKNNIEKNDNQSLWVSFKNKINVIKKAKEVKEKVSNKFYTYTTLTIYLLSFSNVAYLFINHLFIKIPLLLSLTVAFLVNLIIGTVYLFVFAQIMDLVNKFIFKNKLEDNILSFSKDYKEANIIYNENLLLTAKMLEDSNLQYQTLTYLKNLKKLLQQHNKEEDLTLKGMDDYLNNLITKFAEQQYTEANKFIIDNIDDWNSIELGIEKFIQEQLDNKSQNDNNEKFLKSINFSLEDKEVEMEKEYNLKTML